MALPFINIKDYSYELPEERIAKFPLAERDQSRLLVYQHGKISHQVFHQLPDLLPENTLLVFNDTQVIPARLVFEKPTGAEIEIFLLNPVYPSGVLSIAMEAKEKTTWKCTVGNLKRWPDDLILKKQVNGVELMARLNDRAAGTVTLSWAPSQLTFAEIIQATGAVPLPPYIKRNPVEADKQRYQTIYSHYDGAVAAPTAGLHFTERTLEKIREKGIAIDFLTLHVSAGTFLPVKTENASDHVMHEEQIVIRRANLENLLSGKRVVAIGTTALRTLESLYWYGVRLLKNPDAPFAIDSTLPYYLEGQLPDVKSSINAVLKHMEVNDLKELTGYTSIYILPGYTFKVAKGLLTNFHQPGSTLLLLIGALLGLGWKSVYREALENDYRFLSFGDSSLLLPDDQKMV